MQITRHASYLRWVCLALLTLQATFHSLVMHYSRGILHETYNTTTAVLVSEVIKVFFCAYMISQEWKNDHRDDSEKGSYLHIIRSSPKLAIPALIYYIQNILQYLSLQNLDSATFSVFSQLKLLSAAVFSVILLNKHLSWPKWRALTLLFAGVVIILQTTADRSSSGGNKSETHGLFAVGVVAVSMLVLCSGFAGVYFEKMLKREGTASIWVRNFQLSFHSVYMGVIKILLYDIFEIMEKGFFHGYSWVTWLTILIGAFGGLLVGMVVKYGDTIIKGFATAAAIICTTILNHFLFGVHLTVVFSMGVLVVIISVFYYNEPELSLSSPSVIAMSPSTISVTKESS